MKKIILLILTMLSVNVLANDLDENLSVQQNGAEYTIKYFNYKTSTDTYFSDAGLQGSGYTWAALVRAALSTESPDLSPQVDFSPEGGSFIAYTKDEAAANQVQSIIEKLSADINFRNKMVDIATKGGYIE
ncbi:Imm51 family immunity protein [Psychromonas sp. MME2]|uniref:Imm51 family immunity protein n=1 Tax=unclassified Psychromonas TaxID=2614957 RepID=UPI00339D11D7